MRMNLACPRATLKKALDQLKEALSILEYEELMENCI